jgi:heme A synthase
MTWFQRLLLLTFVTTFVLVIVGGTVRATDSGLGCPDWPTCHGSLIPKAEKHTIIEYSHRTIAAVVGVMFLGVTYYAFKTERRRPLIFWLAFSAGVLLAVQIALGAITVKRELPTEITAAHLGTAMAFMGVLIVTSTVSFMRAAGRRVFDGAPDTAFTRLAVLTAVVTLFTLVLGSYMSGTNASLACDGWPLCNGSLLPGGNSDIGLHMLHRMIAGLLGVVLLGATYQAFDERRPASIRALMLLACATYVAQALVGAANIWTELAAAVVVAHLSLAALLWCVMVAVSAISYYLPGAEQAAQAAGRARGGATEWAR